MRIVGGLDTHWAQITFDYADLRTGEEVRGVIRPATREAVRGFVAMLGRKRGAFAMEATTGWRFVTDELVAAGSTLMWPSRPIPGRWRVRNGGPRRIGLTLDC